MIPSTATRLLAVVLGACWNETEKDLGGLPKSLFGGFPLTLIFQGERARGFPHALNSKACEPIPEGSLPTRDAVSSAPTRFFRGVL